MVCERNGSGRMKLRRSVREKRVFYTLFYLFIISFFLYGPIVIIALCHILNVKSVLLCQHDFIKL